MCQYALNAYFLIAWSLYASENIIEIIFRNSKIFEIIFRKLSKLLFETIANIPKINSKTFKKKKINSIMFSKANKDHSNFRNYFLKRLQIFVNVLISIAV